MRQPCRRYVSGKVTGGTLDAPTEASINVPWEAWGGDLTGTFLFRIAWGGTPIVRDDDASIENQTSCETTTPGIKNQTVTLTVNGVVQTVMTDDGQVLNGADKKPCKKLTDNFPQSALNVKFGPATILIEGWDDTDNMAFSKQFDTFVGAGITNPTLTFDVPLQ